MATWKSIEDTNYEVSDDGKVRSVDRQIVRNGRPTQLKGKELASAKHTQGYRQVQLGRGGSRLVHVLVAHAFIGPRPEGLVINHKNGVKHDNRVENLEYCSYSQNMRHACATGLSPKPPLKRGTDQHKAVLTEELVREIRAWYDEGAGIAQMARHYKVGESTVRNVVQRNSWAWLT